MMFNSRGFKGAASHMGQQLEQSLVKASDGGKIPIVMDTSPCLAQMKGALTDPALRSDCCCITNGIVALRWKQSSLQSADAYLCCLTQPVLNFYLVGKAYAIRHPFLPFTVKSQSTVSPRWQRQPGIIGSINLQSG